MIPPSFPLQLAHRAGQGQGNGSTPRFPGGRMVSTSIRRRAGTASPAGKTAAKTVAVAFFELLRLISSQLLASPPPAIGPADA